MESQAQVRLVFAGELLDGHALDDAKRRFSELFKVDGEKLAALFSGKRTVLRRAVSREDADRYVEKLRRIGMRIAVETLDGEPAAKPVVVPSEPTGPLHSFVNAPTAAAPPAAKIPSLLPLEEEVTCPHCNERQPKRFVFCRQCTSDIAKAIAAKEEAAEQQRAERRAERHGNRFAAPRSEVEVRGAAEFVDAPRLLSLSFEGRMGRVSYFNSGFAAMGGVAALGILLAVLVPIFKSAFLAIPMALGMLLLMVWSLRLTALRLHDLNGSGWWAILTFVPWVGNLMALVLLFWPGTRDENDHGPRPRQGNALVSVVVIVGMVILLGAGMSSYKSYVTRMKERERAAESQKTASDTGERDLRSPAARQAYADAYVKATDNKAFATSPSGAFGWVSGKGQVRDAAREAMSACDQKREPYSAPCTLVNVNGMWADELQRANGR